jgi:hypothetical protein
MKLTYGGKLVPLLYANGESNNIPMILPSSVEITGHAFPTSRILDDRFSQEWFEPGIMPDGRECFLVYLFTEEDVKGIEEAENYPWTYENVSMVKLAN